MYREDSTQPIQNALVWSSSGSRVAWATPIGPPDYEDAYTDAEGKAHVRAYTGPSASGWYSSVAACAPGFQSNSYSFQADNGHGNGVYEEEGIVYIHLYRTPSSSVPRIKYGDRLDSPFVVEKMKALENPADRPKYDPYMGVDGHVQGK